MKIMICLVGGQPAPNVFPLKEISPDHLVLVYSDRTHEVAKNIKSVVEKVLEINTIALEEIDSAYDFQAIYTKLSNYLNENGSDTDELIINLTCGTKIMSLAAFELARQRSAKAFYYQSEDNQSLMHYYHFENRQLTFDDKKTIDNFLSLDQYLRLYLTKFKSVKNSKGKDYENNVIGALINNFGEGEVKERQLILDKAQKKPITITQLGEDYELIRSIYPVSSPDVEIDFAIRYKNVVGFAEIKKKAERRAIDQLNSVATSENLGSYIYKFIIHSNELHSHHKDAIREYGIISIKLPSAEADDTLSDDDKALLVNTIKTRLTGK